MSVREIVVTNTLPEHAQQVSETICQAFGVPADECSAAEGCLQAYHIQQHIRQFQHGQFVALMDDQVVGMAATMRTSRPPTAPALSWLAMIGGMHARNHAPDGDWLYGIEFAVRPDFRRMGIGGRLYEARFAMIKHLNLRGFYAGGMLMGYINYRHQMPVADYAAKVMAGDLYDPTVTMQMNRGFAALQYIPDYLQEETCGNGAILIRWDNPDYHEPG